MAKRPSRATKVEIRFDDENLQAWERQPREGDKAWQCFLVYRELPYEENPLERAQRIVSARLYPGKSPSSGRVREIADWAARWSWVERCKAYDRHVDMLRREEFRKALERDAATNINAYRVARNKASRAILLANPETMKTSDAVRMLDVSITGLRREAGLATEIQGSERDDAFVSWLTAGDDPDEEEPDGRPHDPTEAA